MKKRVYKKKVKQMSDDELNEHVGYCENKRKIPILFSEFDRRFSSESDNEDSFSLDEYFEYYANKYILNQ